MYHAKLAEVARGVSTGASTPGSGAGGWKLGNRISATNAGVSVNGSGGIH
jgi:hypothetical protein